MSTRLRGSIDEPHEQWVGLDYVLTHGYPGYPMPRPVDETDARRITIVGHRRAAALARWAKVRAKESEFAAA
jgi:hypothetical protein